MPSSLISCSFGLLPGGQSVEAWTLCGAGGLQLEAITYGAIVTRLFMPDRHGRPTDVVLGFNDLDSYLIAPSYFGAMISRVAGRITGGHFNIDGSGYDLACNDYANHLHGGFRGFDKKVWTATALKNQDGGASLRLTYRSANGEEGYPGTVDVAVTYSVSDDNVFIVETDAETDQPPPFSLTQHFYFNLAGEGAGPITDHELQIHCDEFVFTDERMTLLGRVGPVAGQSNDFRKPRNLGDALPQLFQNHGDLYLMRRRTQDAHGSEALPAARLVHPASGRVLEVSTTETHLQLYAGTGLDGSLTGKSGVPYARHAGGCLECEGYPDRANAPHLGDIILRPGHPRRETTAYAFHLLRH